MSDTTSSWPGETARSTDADRDLGRDPTVSATGELKPEIASFAADARIAGDEVASSAGKAGADVKADIKKGAGELKATAKQSAAEISASAKSAAADVGATVKRAAAEIGETAQRSRAVFDEHQQTLVEQSLRTIQSKSDELKAWAYDKQVEARELVLDRPATATVGAFAAGLIIGLLLSR